jgi:phosphoserine aminotransferase
MATQDTPARLDAQPQTKPRNPNFSSGPCSKRPGWCAAALAGALTGRSHRSKDGKARLKHVIDETHRLLGLPKDYRVGIMPASDTGAVESALWSMLGARGVDVLAWEAFGKGWATDVLKELKLGDVRTIEAPYGELPDLSKIDFGRDVVFTWNGTTSGVRVPNGDWIPTDRQGLTIADATSAAFAQPIDWPKVDVGTFSWQKALGGEAQHGVIVLSPRAVERLMTYSPPWPVPKIFRMTKGTALVDGIFQGETINTPSMLCIEDCRDALTWVASVGGLAGTIARADANAGVVWDWLSESKSFANLAKRSEISSNTSICLTFSEPAVAGRSVSDREALANRMCALLEAEKVAFDIGHYRDAPPGLRIWAGSTVETSDMAALLPWLDWAYAKALS